MAETHNKKPQMSIFGSRSRIALIFLAALTFFSLISFMILVIRTSPAKEVRVPDVVGKKFIDVYNILSRKDMRPSVTFKDVADMDDGIVLSQHPESNTIVKNDTKIRLTVSRSSFYVETPNLVGLAYPIALNKMKNLQYQGRPVSIKKGVISYIPSTKTQENIVIGQSPSAGERITPDRKINLLVSAGDVKEDNRMPDITSQSVDLVYDLLQSKGLVVRQTIIKTGKKQETGIIKGQVPAAGTAVNKGTSVALTVAWYPLDDHPYDAYERVQFKVPSDGKRGLYEAFIQDSTSKRLRFSSKAGPGSTIDFIFKRKGNARVEILVDREPFKVMKIDVQ